MESVLFDFKPLKKKKHEISSFHFYQRKTCHDIFEKILKIFELIQLDNPVSAFSLSQFHHHFGKTYVFRSVEVKYDDENKIMTFCNFVH